ncbi:MAG: RNA polymerase subunit sigma-24, partial [Prevotella sp.]|nr:RNA polymerase subunit sigma-24 [Prevotella sp.]
MKNLAVMTDEELALSYVNGDNRAFDELLLRNQSKIFSYILFVVRDRDTADDVFQETFV